MKFFYLLAVLLFVSATGKLWLLATDPFADLFGGGFPVQILCLAVLVEYLLIGMVTAKVNRTKLWIAYFVFFSLLLTISASRWLLGYQSCGCFGFYDIPIWSTVALNLTIVVTLLILRPHLNNFAMLRDDILHPKTSEQRLKNGREFGLLLGFGFCALVTLFTAHPFVNEAISRTNGRDLIFPLESQFEGLVVGKEKTINVPISNTSLHDARLIGFRTSCNCMLFESRETTLKSGKEELLSLKVIPEKTGRWHQRVICYLEHPVQETLVVDVHGLVADENFSGE